MDDFNMVRDLKNELNPETLCRSQISIILKPFIDDIYYLEFEENPDYKKLRF